MHLRAPAGIVLFLTGFLTSEAVESAAATDDTTPEAKASELAPKLQARGISFSISCGVGSQARFAKGLFLLHNMMYKQAHAEFDSAAASDPQCAMLHWGIAMAQMPDPAA